jgi:serine-type D-Ala-D-Ala carboxypeptidase
VTARLQALLDEGTATGIFPCARAVVLAQGVPRFEGGSGGAGAATVFDLASLTKVMCTTAGLLSLWAEGTLEPTTPLARPFPESAAGRAGVTLADLLRHRAGLPAWVPLFAPVLGAAPGLLEPGCPAPARAAARRAVVEAALATPLAGPPGAHAVYSDVGFVLVGEWLALAAGRPLDALFAERVARPLGLGARFRRLSAPPEDAAGIAPTGAWRPREPAPGQADAWGARPRRPSPPGEVDDDNAWAMDGVAGHAGLFGTAADVAAFGQAVLDELAGAARLAPPALWARAVARDGLTAGSTRGFGFDTRAPGDPPDGASAGRLVGQVSPGAVGHLGFTGVSLWVDLGRRLVVALCTNRTAGGRADTRIRAFRPRFHDAVVEALGGV